MNNDFSSIKLKIASPEQVLDWSYGEVLKPETINYRTQKPEKDSLFSEKIFGPTKDWECYCGKYKRIRYKGIVCDRCGVEVTTSKVRRERMGHVALAVPVAHIWFLRGVPSRIGMILGLSIKDLENVVYFASYIITQVDEDARKETLEAINKEWKAKMKGLKLSSAEAKILEANKNKAKEELMMLETKKILSEVEYYNLSLKYGQIFKAGIGGEAIYELLSQVDLKKIEEEFKKDSEKVSSANANKVLRRLKLVQGFIKENIRPEWMMIKILPVLPADLRPMVPLEGGRFATSDLNDLYRRVINRNNRLKKLIELRAPEVITRNEKRMLQEAVDALIDNSARRGQTSVVASTGQRRPLRSLADMLRGKQGRFRQNLLGKRVDYSARSVIVSGPDLQLHQCGLPKAMALELFKPFVIHELIKRELAYNVRSASHLIEQQTNEVWDILEDVIKNKFVLLNRAPTLHRLGIQAFQPILIEGQAIQIHPLVCSAFNADFDGDQMAVHLPLTETAQREAREIMCAVNNLLKPATGKPIVSPTNDIVLGCYFLTQKRSGLAGDGKIFISTKEAILAYENGFVHLHSPIKVRKEKEIVETTVGRIIFNQQLPKELQGVEETVDKKGLSRLIEQSVILCEQSETVAMLDNIKKVGFQYATLSGISWGMDDLKEPAKRAEIIEEADKKTDTIRKQYDLGLLSDSEKKDLIVRIWLAARDEIAKEVKDNLGEDDMASIIINSGARGSISQLCQMSGMKGPVINPSGETLELPIRSNYKKGLDVLEYFIATHGMRKGLVDTALKTARAGYLTRRLVDVAQDVVIRAEDCKDKIGIILNKKDAEDLGYTIGQRAVGRILLEDVKDLESGETVVKKGTLVTEEMKEIIDKVNPDSLKVRSVLSCKLSRGVCRKCYGADLGRKGLIKIGEAVGIVTAQSIGEPGTQMTMRTFHSGGIATRDITHGLPRVEEIFECRSPKGRACIADVKGQVKEIKDGLIIVLDDKTKKEKEYAIPLNLVPNVKVGDLVTPGQLLIEGNVDLQELFKISGAEAVRRYILREILTIYTLEGVNLQEKHIEVIIKQMFSRIKILDFGDSEFLEGDEVTRTRFIEENEKLKEQGKTLAVGEALLTGITRASLSTDSFLSAASFQEAQRVLTSAAVSGKEDKLFGLKENVIIGRLIPAGTGYQAKTESL